MQVVQPNDTCKDGEAIIYLIGDKDAAVHSEPPIHAPRIFVSILPGSKRQINEWRVSNLLREFT